MLEAMVLCLPQSLLAGMPVMRLTDAASLRVEAISFFLLLFFISALIVQLLWNWLRRDFTRLPRLTYGKSMALVGLWGMLFVLVLTMISGARELMTPGAWEPNGVTYRLGTGSGSKADLDSRRRSKLGELKVNLWAYAKQHEGRFPADGHDGSDIDRTAWQSPDPSRMPYRYYPPSTQHTIKGILAIEPDIFPHPLMVLRTDGTIDAASDAEMTAAAGVQVSP